MQKVLLILSLALVMLFSCKKADPPYNGEFEISGKVLDELTAKPIPHATVGVLEIRHDDYLGMGAKTVVSGYADENGAFSYKFPVNEHNNYYELAARENDKYFEKTSFARISFNKNGKTTQNVTLMPKGYLKLHIKGNKGGWTMSGGSGDLGRHYSGTDTIKILSYTPNTVRKITYVIRDENNNILNTLTFESLIPPPPDTAFYLIEF